VSVHCSSLELQPIAVSPRQLCVFCLERDQIERAKISDKEGLEEYCYLTPWN